MTAITVIGATGYAGSCIAREAATRSHQVTGLSRHAPAEPVEGVRYVQADVFDADRVGEVVRGADVVVGALSPRGDLTGKILSAYDRLANLAAEASARFVVVGGFTSLRPAEGEPRFIDEGKIAPEYAGEARELTDVVDFLGTTPDGLDWLFVSPAQDFGGYNPGEKRGTYRVGGTIALFDADGKSDVSGADFAAAVVDEIERGAHRRTQISIAY